MSTAFLSNNKLRMKQSNENLVISVLKQLNTATCAEISKATGLSVATCGNILKRLLDSNEVLEGKFESQSSGRPAKQYIYNENFSLVVALTLHEENASCLLQYAIANLYGEILEKETFKYETITTTLLNDLIDKSQEKYPTIKAIGMGVPSVINQNGTIVSSDIEEINGMNLSDLICTKDYNIKTSINTSPSLSIYGYYKQHPELKGKAIVSLICPNNLGAGIVVNDHIYNGDFSVGGEINFIAQNFLKKYMPMEDINSRYLQDIMFSITALLATINPTSIVLMGEDFSPEIYRELQSCCNELFPSGFTPNLVHLSNYRDVYLNGAIQTAIDQLAPKVQLIEK